MRRYERGHREGYAKKAYAAPVAIPSVGEGVARCEKRLCDRATGGRTSFAANLSTAVKGAASGTLITCKTQACQARLQFMAGCSFRPDSARALCGHGACSHLVRQLGVNYTLCIWHEIHTSCIPNVVPFWVARINDDHAYLLGESVAWETATRDFRREKFVHVEE